jgi:hypothetical protein
MSTTTTSFQQRRAPCDRIVDGEHFEDVDEGCHLADNWYFACGCRIIVHEYPDGTFQSKMIHHNGKVLFDEIIAEHHP